MIALDGRLWAAVLAYSDAELDLPASAVAVAVFRLGRGVATSGMRVARGRRGLKSMPQTEPIAVTVIGPGKALITRASCN
jgi:hypothetical protein